MLGGVGDGEDNLEADVKSVSESLGNLGDSAVKQDGWSQNGFLSQPLIDEIGRVLDLGVAEGAFRTGIDPLQLYVSIVALSVHHINNAATLSATFGRDLTKADWLAERRAHVVDMIMSTVRRGAGASAG